MYSAYASPYSGLRLFTLRDDMHKGQSAFTPTSQRCYICADPELPRDPVRWGLATVSAIGDIHPALQLKDPATSMGSADAGARDLALPIAEVEFLP